MNGRLTAGRKPFSYEDAKPHKDSSNQWSSTENNRNNARNVNFNNGNANNNNKNNGNVVRPVAASQDYDAPEAFVASVWEAYYDCLRGKMRSKQAVEYMEIADEDIPVLAQELWRGTYQPGTSTCFLGSLSEVEGSVRGQLPRPHRSPLDMPTAQSSVRRAVRETGECLVQLPQGVRDGEGRAACGQGNGASELQLSQEGLGVQGRLGWILHVDRQGTVVVSLGTLHPSPAHTLRASGMEEPRHGHTCSAQHVRYAGNVLGHPDQDNQGSGDAPSRKGLHTEHTRPRMAWAGPEQESVHQPDGRAYWQLDDAIVCQLPDVALRGLYPMAIQTKELLLRTVRGRLCYCVRRPTLPCGQHSEDRSVFERQTTAQTTQRQTVSATRVAWSEVCRSLYQTQEDISFEPNRIAHDGAVPRLQEDDGGEGLGRVGHGYHAANPQLVLGLHAEA